MPGVGQQCEGVREQARHDLQAEDDQDQRQCDGERPTMANPGSPRSETVVVSVGSAHPDRLPGATKNEKW